ncbi:MAG: Zn-dependent alcohol dehydrogenase [Verrucomicrobiaceae bacterium]|nr:Zn-dependent alcohol dehydrogenase [Verrucomicrobiaceae bacterium]
MSAQTITARAAVLYEAGKPLSIEEVQVEPPRKGEVLVRMKAAGVCHSDLHVMKGDLHMPMPIIPGHEGSGVIESVGEGVTSVAPGDHVIPVWRASCGQCEYCLAGRPALCDMGTKMRFEGVMPDGSMRFRNSAGAPIRHYAGVSTFATMATMPEAAVVKIPKDCSFEHAALIGCGVITGVGAVSDAAKIHPGCSVAVFGVGGIGLNIVQGARMMSARQIIAVDIHAGKEAKARELGATHFVNAAECDPVQAVKDLTGGKGVDHAFEAVGLTATIEQAYDSLKKGGTCVVAGISRADVRARINVNQLVYAEKTLKGTLYGSMRPRVDLLALIELHRVGKLALDPLLTRTWRLDEINEAYAALERGEVARTLIVF